MKYSHLITGHFSLETTPKVIVLDTRTKRWRSESSSNKPSGLMDWEALSELQQELINQTESNISIGSTHLWRENDRNYSTIFYFYRFTSHG